MKRFSVRSLVAPVVLLVLLAACGGGGDAATTTTSILSTTSTTITPPPTITLVTTTTAPPTTVTGTGEYGVVGVGPNERLNVRAAAGTGNDVVGTLEYNSGSITRVGPVDSVDGAEWWSIEAGGVSGWVHSGFLDLLASPTNATEAYKLNIGDQTVALPSELVDLVVGSIVDGGDGGAVEVKVAGILVGEPSVGVVEVTGYADDSVGGEHIVITMEPDDSFGWVISNVESWPRCTRGVTAEGLCV